MLSPVANWRENLQKIALGVHEDDDDDELEIYGYANGEDSSASDRRNSHSFAHSTSVSPTPMMNGLNSAYSLEIEQYKAEVKRLQESESEIKALSVNYAALLKEKEDQISRLNKENGALKHNLDSTTSALNGFKESLRASTNTSNAMKENGDQSPSQQLKIANHVKSRSAGNSNGVVSKQDIITNGTRETTHLHIQEKEKVKELADLLEERNRSLAAQQAKHDLQIRELKMELEKEWKERVSIQSTLQEERKLNATLQDQLKSRQAEKDNNSVEINHMRKELDEKISEIVLLRMELKEHSANGETDLGSLKRTIDNLEKEKCTLKTEKNELETALRKKGNLSSDKGPSSNLSQDIAGTSPGREELEQSVIKLEKSLEETRRERDKAKKELNRLKQHLLDKETEESEKMDQDSKIIEDLRENNDHQKTKILHLEKALKQAIAVQDEIRMSNNSEIQKCNEIISELNRKLASCVNTIDAKNVELLNLQTALGQYYAEIEAKERLERDLTLAREELAKFSELLKGADKQEESLKREKEEILAKLSQAEKALAEANKRVNKLEEDNAKLRRALEQSMTRLNRMSVDSDFLVDRRIVIKLLVTYFQRNHSKEVVDLMVRMLGFSEEDKQRIGVAQQHGAGGGKGGVVRGVLLGLPGRLVGGMLGGGDPHANNNVASEENHSFADLWVDFLLTETDEKERRNRLENGPPPTVVVDTRSSGNATNSAAASLFPDTSSRTNTAAAAAPSAPNFSRYSFSANQEEPMLQGNNRRSIYEPYSSEFSTVPLLSSSESTPSWMEQPPPPPPLPRRY